MIHQCVSENLWLRNMLGIDVSAPPLPARETRIDFLERYAEDSADALLRGERAGGRKAALPGPGGHPVTERG